MAILAKLSPPTANVDTLLYRVPNQRRAVVVSSRGGIHQGESTDAVTPYLRAVLGLMGIHEVEFIYAEGLDNRPHGRDAGIASARAQIADLAVPA